MNIYPRNSVSIQICFVYKWTQISTGKWYIGSRTAKHCNPNDDYICTSKIVKPMIEANSEDWIREILETGSKDDMLLLEHELLKCLNASKSEYSYNKCNGGGTFSNAGRITSNETRKKLSIAAKGRLHSDETKIKLSIANKGKIRTEEAIEKGRIANTGKKHSEEHCRKISESQKGKIISVEHRKQISDAHTGRIISLEHRLAISNTAKNRIFNCPHCNKSGGMGMTRWHFDNCKFKIEKTY